MNLPFHINADQLSRFCQRWKVAELSVFGSALRPDFSQNSDIDLLVTPADGADWSLVDHVRMQRELAELFGRPVDLVSRPGIERSGNRHRKETILSTAEPIFHAA